VDDGYKTRSGYLYIFIMILYYAYVENKIYKINPGEPFL
jgi:hypothetical protein